MVKGGEGDVEGRGFMSGPSTGTHNRQSTTYHGMAPVTHSQNPYNKYTQDGDSIDDGINMDLSPEHSDSEEHGARGGAGHEMPDEEEVLRQFHDYLEVMSPLSEPELKAMQNASTEDKWRLIYNQKCRSPVFPLSHYIESMKRHLNSKKRKSSSWAKRSPKDMNPLAHTLRKLKADLKLSGQSFLLEFCRQPNDGVRLLVQVLQDIQYDQMAAQTTRKSKAEELKRTVIDEYDCLLCLRAAVSCQEGLRRLAQLDRALESVSQAVMGSFVKSRVMGVQILTMMCDLDEGYQLVMDTITRTKLQHAESVRFKFLVGMLSSDSTIYMPFVIACVSFFNKLVGCNSKANAKVFLQYELEMAGFDPTKLDKYTYGHRYECRDLKAELGVWRDNYIDVNASHGQMMSVENRNQLLRDEVSRLQKQIKAIEMEKEKQNKEETKMAEKVDEYRERAAELQDTLEKLRREFQKENGPELDEVDKEIYDALKPLDKPEESGFNTFRHTVRYTNASLSDAVSSMSDAPPSPPVLPPLPPPPPPSFLSQTVRQKVVTQVDLPLLNWTPLYSVGNTIFSNIDDDALLRKIDFREFESLFKLPKKKETQETKHKRERIFSHNSDLIHFVGLNRAKNLMITFKKTGLRIGDICKAIDTCNARVLHGEYAELLLKFVPTKEELKQLAAHRAEYHKMAEAEKFLFQLAQVHRLEAKLSILAFIAIFHELIQSVEPKMDCIHRAASSVFRNAKLERIFETILAFGNYINSAKRGYALGFTLPSLAKLLDVKSTDKKLTLLHFLVEFIDIHHHDLMNFYDELDINVDKGASYHALSLDLAGLRKGLDLVKFEREHQPDNAILEDFYESASIKIAEVADKFRMMEESYRDVCQKFGENYKGIEPDEFFKPLTDFVYAYKKSERENYERHHPEEVEAPVSPRSKTNQSAPGTPLSPRIKDFLGIPPVSTSHSVPSSPNTANKNITDKRPGIAPKNSVRTPPHTAMKNTTDKRPEIAPKSSSSLLRSGEIVNNQPVKKLGIVALAAKKYESEAIFTTALAKRPNKIPIRDPPTEDIYDDCLVNKDDRLSKNENAEQYYDDVFDTPYIKQNGTTEDLYDDVEISKNSQTNGQKTSNEDIYAEIPYDEIKEHKKEEPKQSRNTKAPVLKAKAAKNKKEHKKGVAPPPPAQQPEEYYDDTMIDRKPMVNGGPSNIKKAKPREKPPTLSVDTKESSKRSMAEPTEYLEPTTPSDVKHALEQLDRINQAFDFEEAESSYL